MVIFGDNGQKIAEGKGDICFVMAFNDQHKKIIHVYYVLGVTKHLLSIEQASNNGLTI